MNQTKLTRFFINNAVTILFVIISILAIPVSGYSIPYLAQEIITRLGRNMFLVLSLLIPIIAGMGLNFGIVLGAMVGQIGLIFVSDRNILGIQGNVWTEYIADFGHVQRMTLPRMAAIAEIAWAYDRKDYDNYEKRAKRLLPELYGNAKLKFSEFFFEDIE